MPRPIRPRRATRSSGKIQEAPKELVSPPLSRRKKRQVSSPRSATPTRSLGRRADQNARARLAGKVPVLPPITTQGPLYDTVAATVAATAVQDDRSPRPARAFSAHRSIPLEDPDDFHRTETRNLILQNYSDAAIDRLDTRELLDLLQNCMGVFDLSPTDRIVLLSKLVLIDATLANASMYTPPPTPVRNKKTEHRAEKKKRQSKFPILEAAAIPPSFANASVDSISHTTEPMISHDGLKRVETWIDRRFVEVATGASAAEGEAASLLSPGVEHPVTVGSLLAKISTTSCL